MNESVHQLQLSDCENFYEIMKTRKSCRHFVKSSIDLTEIQTCILTAGLAPSGGNTQPWFFAVVTDPELKAKLREQAEVEEKEFYSNRASEEFLNDLAQFKTDWQKPHLTDAAALIVIFSKNYNSVGSEKKRCYYPRESTGIATGMLITALHLAGYSTLTHTPSPMHFLNKLLDRPSDEKPFLILAVGQKNPAIPQLQTSKKEANEILKFY